MDNGLDGSPPPTRDGRGNPRRVIGIRRINYSGTGLPPVETASSFEDIHSGGASASEPVPEKQGESPESPRPPELPALNQEEIQAFYRESLLAMNAAESARKLVSSTTPDNELVFYDSSSSGSQATNLEPGGSRSHMTQSPRSHMTQSPHEDRMSLHSVVSDDLRCKDARGATSPGVHSSRANMPATDVNIPRATRAAHDSVSRATTPADDSFSRATISADDRASHATTQVAGAQSSRAATPAADNSATSAAHDSDSRARAANASASCTSAPAADAHSSRATTPVAVEDTSQDPVNELVSSARQTTGICERIRRAFSRLFLPFRSCFGHS